jgi:hypothetical protein
LSHVAAFVQDRYYSAPGQVLETVIAHRWPVFLVTLWLPALVLVLWPRGGLGSLQSWRGG